MTLMFANMWQFEHYLDGMVEGRSGCSLVDVASHSPFHTADSPPQPNGRHQLKQPAAEH